MKKKGFTLIEIIGALVILAIIALIATPLVMNIIKNSKESARKRSIDNYGKAIELAITSYLLDNGKFPTEVSQLNIEYSGSKVECGVEYINDDNSIYLESCKVNDRLVENYTYGKDGRPAALQLISKSNSINITNYNDGNKGEMYTFNHEATEQTPALTDYRYIGNVPNNYVSFNNGEIWRIIGIFDVESENGNFEKRIKLIRNDDLPQTMKWDDNNINEWSTATLNIYLNGDYYNSMDILSKSLIASSKYYLGEVDGFVLTDGEATYKRERSTKTYVEDGVSRSLNWMGKVALMYPTDYIYNYALGVDDTCYNECSKCNSNNSTNTVPSSGWIYNTFNGYRNETISPAYAHPDTTEYIWSTGNFYYGGYYRPIEKAYVKPVLYLNSNVKIKQGDGTIDNPYVFEL